MEETERPKCLDQAYVVWLSLGIALLLFVLITIILNTNPVPSHGLVFFFGIVIVLCAGNLRKGWRGPRIVLALIAALFLYLAASTFVGTGPGIEFMAMTLVAAAAVVGTVLMFRAEANAYIRALMSR
ncbi:hypothetical protein [Actinokineospora xionganensis]|uniref:Transmembrane protein n=1 Tax=Actinokineospora xionganensis TaxID=2684470 RepID=A0ABR7L7G5_9PSEU|nr:hypothetical protein [Actinokineospora xionganensis]MBC6448625.1 hypothetical protein [Actinokineospora xionganensis]